MNHIQQFQALHHADEMLFLGNAWDVLSARTLEQSGFRAIGTTSWGVAASLGYIPVSADIEAGYAETRGQIVENVLRTADRDTALLYAANRQG